MWMTFDSCEFRTDLESRKGKAYSAFLLSGTKKGFGDAPDEPYSKPFFEGHLVTVKQGKNEFEMHLNEFFELCEPGDTISIKQEKAGSELWNWRISEVENKTRSVVAGDSVSAVGSAQSSASNPAVFDEIKATVMVGALASAGVFKMELEGKDAFEIEEFINSEVDKRVPSVPVESI